KKIVLQAQRVVGVVLFGDARDAMFYTQLIKEGRDVGDAREDLIFGQSYFEARGGAPSPTPTPMRDDAEVCGCNGVCKGDIVSTIRARALTTLAQVRSYTKASASCGSCTPQVEQILCETIGDDYAPDVGEPPVCRCTTMTHGAVRRAIVEQELRDMQQVMSQLEWGSPDGCHKCRPALNYYLIAAWPGEYQDDSQSRFVNERLHANIQKDGSYSVVPRIWGGVTTASELRAMADVADKYQVRTIKITGGQRIDLLGVKKEDLQDVWRDLNAAGLVSGHAYGKALRTVKTCVGDEWCRMGVQDSTTMGQRLERLTWGAWAPHKVKMGVSGCPRNCAEATIKDFGAVAVESGWELYVAGNGGTRVRAADRLCKVGTQEEVLEYGAAFLQLYREEGYYATERTAHFIERVGLEYIRQKIVESPDSRQALYARFVKAQVHAQDDPWRERAREPVFDKQYRRLAVLSDAPHGPVAAAMPR
ncbi:MAG: (2Fe-2S)-binding protein, partial [Polyangiaceae bacterium]